MWYLRSYSWAHEAIVSSAQLARYRTFPGSASGNMVSAARRALTPKPRIRKRAPNQITIPHRHTGSTRRVMPRGADALFHGINNARGLIRLEQEAPCLGQQIGSRRGAARVTDG